MSSHRRKQQGKKDKILERRDVCAPGANYRFTILGITADNNNCRENRTELLLSCDRAAPTHMKPAGHLGDNSSKI